MAPINTLNVVLMVTMASVLAAAVDLASVQRDRAMATEAIERPSHRATSFVPRLGKRDEEAQPSPGDFKPHLPANCPTAASSGATSGSSPGPEVLTPFADYLVNGSGELDQLVNADNMDWIPRPSARATRQHRPVDELGPLIRFAMHNPELIREVRASMDGLGYPSEGKRVAFTPRIG